jgi:hypothetical protein
MISRRRIMVAPSLEMVAPPLSSWMSLSIPQGPSVVRTVSATAVHALMLLTTWPFPCDVSVPSFNRMICGCCGIGKRGEHEMSVGGASGIAHSRRARRVVRCLPSSTPCWGAWGWRRFEGLGRGDLWRRRQRRGGVAAPRVLLEFELSGDGLRRRGPRVLGGSQFGCVWAVA